MDAAVFHDVVVDEGVFTVELDLLDDSVMIKDFLEEEASKVLVNLRGLIFNAMQYQ